MRTLLLLLFFGMVVSCGGEPVTTDPGENMSSSGSSSSSSSSGANKPTGEDLYFQSLGGAASCASCHGDKGQGVANRGGEILSCDHNCGSLGALEAKIEISMPAGAPLACDAACSAALSDYIYHELQGNPRVALDCADTEIQKASPVRRLNKLEIINVMNDVFNNRGGGIMRNSLPDEFELVGGFATVGSAMSTSNDWTRAYFNGVVKAVDTIITTGRFKSDCSLGMGALADDRVAAMAAPDQCDTTQQCKNKFGPSASDCMNSKAPSSVCMCGNKRCDANDNGSSSSSSSSGGSGTAGSTACFVSDIKHVGELLFRRSLTNQEVDNLKAIRSAARNNTEGDKAALISLFTSPFFLFTYPDNDRSTPSDLTGKELAERLALTLWGSVPDKALLEAARANNLKGAGLEAQIDRMINDPKFKRFVDIFVDPWIGLSGYVHSGRDVGTSDQAWADLLADMRTETYTFFQYLVSNNLPLNEMYTANYSFINARLADHYGVSANGLNNNDFVKVTMPRDQNRRGLMTHASVLAKAFDGNKTSVVKRGVVVLEAFTCNAPEAPDNPAIAEQINNQANGNRTEKEKIHDRASNTACAGCHAAIDPIGWVFTDYGIAGEKVDLDPDGDPLSTGGNLYGTNFNSAYDMMDILVERNDFAPCFSNKFLIHAIGRRVDKNAREDKCEIDSAINRATFNDNVGMRDLIKALLMSRMATSNGTNLE